MDIAFQRSIDQRSGTVHDAASVVILLAAAPVVDEPTLMQNGRIH
jgi:hypothetical protein